MSAFSQPQPQPDPALAPADVYAQLEPAVQRLIVAVATLYGGRWDDCAEDIRRRRAGRPYLYRLQLGLDDELGWLRRLADYETARGETFALAALPLEASR